MASRQEITERLRRESYAKRATALREAAQKQASNIPIISAYGSSSGGGGGSSSSYPDRVDISIEGKFVGFACNTKDMYNDGDTPIYYGEIYFEKVPRGIYLYWNGSNWGIDDDLDPPYQAIGPTTKDNVYGTYTDDKGFIGEVSAYSGDLSKECPALPSGPGGIVTSFISSPEIGVTWSWEGVPTRIGSDEYEAAGRISGFQTNDLPASVDTLTGSFRLTYKSSTSSWTITNNGPIAMWDMTEPISTTVFSLLAGGQVVLTGDNPATDTIGYFDKGTFGGQVTYISF